MTHTYFGYSEQNHRKTTDLCESQIFGPTLSHVVFFNTLGFMYFVVFLDVYGWPLWNISWSIAICGGSAQPRSLWKSNFFCRLRIDCPHSCIKVARAGGTIIRLMMEIHAKTARNPIDFWTGTLDQMRRPSLEFWSLAIDILNKRFEHDKMGF